MTILIILFLAISFLFYLGKVVLWIYINFKHERQVNHSNYVNPKDHEDSIQWELVRRKSDRWNELFGENIYPGYGKLYDREFEVWYCDIGAKVRKNIQGHHDRYPLNYRPNNSSTITGKDVDLHYLFNTKNYKDLYTGLDEKNRKRWYFALINYTPTGIETDRAIFVCQAEELSIPEGWTLVRRKSDEWFKNGFGDNILFPGYGEIYERTFDVWYTNVGSRTKIVQPEFKDKATLNLPDGICGDLKNLRSKNVHFEKLFNTQGYEKLLSALDKKERRRWYFGLKKTEPTYIYTASAE
jgi:hypothetical protein